MSFFSCFFIGFLKEFSFEASLDKADRLNTCRTKPNGQFVGFYSFNLFLKTCKDEAFLSSSGNSGHILTPKFDTISLPNNVVVKFFEATWEPLFKL